MKKDNNKTFNIIYAIVGLITFLIAVAGATLAYFSASDKSNPGDITGATVEAGGLVLDVTKLTDTGNSLIPINFIPNQTEILNNGVGTGTYSDNQASQFNDAMLNKCLDTNNNEVCQVYKIVVENQSETVTMSIRGKLDLTSEEETGTSNVYWKLINAKTTIVSSTEGQTIEKEILDTASEMPGALPVKQNATTGNYLTIDSTGSEVSLKLEAKQKEEIFIVVWLEELGIAQEDQDASTTESKRTYNGKVVVNAVDEDGAPSGVTATFFS